VKFDAPDNHALSETDLAGIVTAKSGFEELSLDGVGCRAFNNGLADPSCIINTTGKAEDICRAFLTEYSLNSFAAHLVDELLGFLPSERRRLRRRWAGSRC